MLNGLIVFAALASVFLAALSGQMQALTDAIVSSARGAVELAIGLIGLMAFFLGLMRVIEDAGALRHLARLIGPSCNASSRGFPSSACRIAIEGDDGEVGPCEPAAMPLPSQVMPAARGGGALPLTRIRVWSGARPRRGTGGDGAAAPFTLRCASASRPASAAEAG